MTKNELIYTVFEKLNIQSDDTDLTEELVSSLLDTKRAMLLKQQYAKNAWHMPIEIKQELCLSLSLVDKVDGYSCAGKILATDALPRSIKIKGKEGPLAVRKEDSTEIAITIVAIERLPYLFENKFTQHLTYAAVDFSGKLFLISKDNKLRFLQSIKVTDIFESPDEVLSLTCSYDSNKDKWDVDYPIESAMADIAVDLVVKELTRTLGIPGDNVNDATDGRR
jgi:hypothetical protein